MTPPIEVCLRTNPRPMLLGAVCGAVCAAAAVGVLATTESPAHWPLLMGAGAIILFGTATTLAALVHAKLPRLAFQAQHLLVYTGGLKPICVPLDAVEVFFHGQGKTEVQPRGHRAETKNVVVRLAERSKDWHDRDMRFGFGKWEDGYISLNGTWCEPITVDLLKQMNHELVIRKRALRASEELAN